MSQPISVQYSDLSTHSSHISGDSVKALHNELKKISELRSGSYETHDHVIRLPLDPHILVESKHMAERYYTSNLKYIILVGIGGQNLGAKAIYDALRGSFDLATDHVPKIIFLDTISIPALHEIKEVLRNEIRTKEEILINLSSKSGGTTETIANFELIYAFLKKHIEGIDERIVVTSDGDSALAEIARKRGYGLLEMPKKVGGRFSVFSPSGIFPLLLAGIDVVALRDGARDVLTEEFSETRGSQTAKYAAETLYKEMSQKHLSILNIFHFHPELESLGKWERQLIAESLGKEKDISGRTVRQGITPIVSIGSTDLHSMAQLYFGGPKDKFTMMIHAELSTTERMAQKGPLHDLAPWLPGRNPLELNDAIFKGVQRAYHKHELPVLEVTLPALSAYALGAYMEWRMLFTIYLATLLHVNPYDQPNVEDYKQETRRLLEATQTK